LKKVTYWVDPTSSLASVRLRALEISKLFPRGLKPLFKTEHHSFDPLKASDIIVFMKHFDVQGNLDLALKAKKKRKVVTVFDICDFHFDNEQLSDYYIQMAKLCDYVTCSSPLLCQMVLAYTSRVAHYLPDPATYPSLPPSIGNCKKLVWYGHPLNLGTLKPLIKALEDNRKDFPDTTLDVFTATNREEAVSENIIIRKWSMDRIKETIKDYNLVIIPTDYSLKTLCKSPNRGIDGVMSGKGIITNNPFLYSEVDEALVKVGEVSTFLEKLKKLQESEKERNKLTKGVLEAQKRIKDKYSLEAVAEEYLDFYSNILNQTGLATPDKEIKYHG
jgi:hypothetical protein